MMQLPDKDRIRKASPRLWELCIVYVAVITPMFLWASKVDGDEFVKASTGAGFAAVAAVMMTIYKLWKGTE